MSVDAKRSAVSYEIPEPSPVQAVSFRKTPASHAVTTRAETPITRTVRFLFIAATLIALVYGWSLASQEEFIPKEGVGYWIGIAGGTLLLLQLAYPLRKRARFMRRVGSAPTWFRLHMVLGIIGPLLILYHSNYSLGATNSNVALITMLIVAVSGIVGRYFYGKVHNGLYGAHTNLQDLLAEATALLRVIESDVGGANGAIAARLTEFGEDALAIRRTLLSSFAQALRLGFTTPFARWRIMASVRRTINQNAQRLKWTAPERRLHYKAAKQHVRGYLEAVVKGSELAFYDRLFGLWHLLHMPLYILLIVTGTVHVVAVHLY